MKSNRKFDRSLSIYAHFDDAKSDARESALYNGEVFFLSRLLRTLVCNFYFSRGGRKRIKEDYTMNYNLIISVVSGLI